MHRDMPTDTPLDSLLATLAADRATLRAAVDAVPPQFRDERPATDGWSVAQVLEHLAIVEERAVTIVADLAAQAPATDASRALPPSAFDRSALRDRTQRIEAPAPIQPTGTVDADAAWERLTRSRSALASALAAAADRDLGAVTRVHPRLGTLTGWQWVAALGGHEERHAAQIREIAAQHGA